MLQTELVTGNVSTGKTTYLIEKANMIAAKNTDSKILFATPSKASQLKIKDKMRRTNIDVLTPMELAATAKRLLEGSMWGFDYETSWVSTDQVKNTIKEFIKKRGYSIEELKKALWFMVSAERNLWQDSEWQSHLYMWYGAEDYRIGEVIEQVKDFLHENNAALIPMIFNQISNGLKGCEYMLGYSHILIDDIQNMPLNELLFIAKLATEHRNITLAFDKNKLINSWDEGTSENIMDIMLTLYPDLQINELTETIGLGWQIKEVCDTILSEGRLELPAKDKIRIYTNPHEISEARAIIDQVIKVAVKYPDKSLLVTYRQAWFGRNIIDEAIRRNIYADIRTKANKSIIMPAELFADYLSLANNPMNGAAFFNAMNQPARKLGTGAWADLMELRHLRDIPDWLDTVDMLYEVKGVRRSQVDALNLFKTHISNLMFLKGQEISSYMLHEIGLEAWVLKKWGNGASIAIEWLKEASAQSSNIEECEQAFNLLRIGHTGRQSQVTIAPISEAITERFDYVWVAGIEKGIFPMFNDNTQYWSETVVSRDTKALYSIVSRANIGAVLWSAEIRNINGYWKRTTISPMVRAIATEEYQGNRGRKPKSKSLKSFAFQGV